MIRNPIAVKRAVRRLLDFSLTEVRAAWMEICLERQETCMYRYIDGEHEGKGR